MPRRSTNKSSSPVQRRQSARIAAASANKSPTPSPSPKKIRRSTKRDSASKSDAPVENVDHNGNESSSKQAPVLEEPPEKKARIEETNDTLEKEPETIQEQAPKEETTNDGEASKAEHDVAEEADFEVVDKASAPAADSEEVKKAIEAQGEDGQLLVNYVQVVKDELPAVVPETNVSASEEKQHQQSANGTVKGDGTPAETTAEKRSPEQSKEEVPDTKEASH
ncbi:unnamed protein product [Hymenolepis diminuta]|uniref:Nucleolin 1-like n=1 Tax=Hymenolepis diminuta TaxID=6216 RepID=A0A0R3SR42_HYMDI|nr:unnamed protein product [Hymenolepis diminuta]VUZ55631.1 unnamed protein product [Hymenolepis diminuta]